ncbi:MAG: hypothetical protein MJ106_02315 [Lentisphaeria bacterium]|nr:hypothetical protein [Lentisphaeria bacterium]
MSRILLIDAYSQIYRLFYAIRMLTSAKGEPANALFGMARLFLQLDAEFPTEFGALVFDLGKCTRRCGLHPQYKAQRPPMPAELRAQISRIKEFAQAFGWPVVQREGFEADDLLAGISSQRGDSSVLILTGDKDLGQLVADNQINLLKPGNAKNPWECLDEAAISAKFGVKPSQVCDYLSLLGDTVDNIPGIPGRGPKTAAQLLNEYGPIDNTLAAIDSTPSGKLKDTLVAEKEHILLNRELVRLDNALPEAWNGTESIRRNRPDWQKLLTLCADEGFNAIAAEIKKRSAPQQQFFDF